MLSAFSVHLQLFPLESSKQNKIASQYLLSFNLSVNVSSSEAVLSETPALTHCHGMKLVQKLLLSLSCIASQPVFASPQSPFLKHSLFQGSEIGRGCESTRNEYNDRSLELGGQSCHPVVELKLWLYNWQTFCVFSSLSAQLSQPAVSIEGQVSNPPSTSSTEVNSQTIPEKQPSQEVKMEAKMEVDPPEPADAQPEDIPEVRAGRGLLLVRASG